MTGIEPTGVVGGQAIERACTILKEMARHGRQGARLIDLTRATGLSRPTVHRMLQSLMQEGFATQHETRRYGLGPMLFELGLFAPSPVENLERFRPILQDLANRCGDTAHLMIRRGPDVVYLMRAEGAFPIRAYVIAVGERLPLAASLGGIALLAEGPDQEIEEAMQGFDPADETLRNASVESVMAQVAFVRQHGYGWGVDVVMEGVAGLAAIVPNRNGTPYLAISVSGIKSRLGPDRAPLVSAMVRSACEDIAILNAAPPARRTRTTAT